MITLLPSSPHSDMNPIKCLGLKMCLGLLGSNHFSEGIFVTTNKKFQTTKQPKAIKKKHLRGIVEQSLGDFEL